ncbi:hypothetical protein LMG3412_05047 [Achromobacter deleyi]|nr:hypothetical protein LMG3412_05047 [Achromobacter deleyi]
MVVWKPRLSGWMNEAKVVYMPPAMPAYAADSVKAVRLMALTFTPMAWAATSLSRTARKADPSCERDSAMVAHSSSAAIATTNG